MAFSDEVIVRFTADNTQLLQQINQIASASSNAASRTSRTTQGMAAMGRQAQANTRVFNIQNRTLEQSSGLLKNLQQNTGDLSTSFRRSAQSIQTNIGWLDKLSIQADRASMTMWRFSMAGISLQQLAATTGAVAIGFGLVTKKMVESFSMVDRIKRQFASIYQSAEIGGKMVDQLVTDAVKIRYPVEQVLEAGRLLAIEGFNPKDLIYDMSDLAAGVNQEGITIVNATRAFVDATNGQFRRLKETFQITREDAMAFAPDAFQGPNNQISNQAKATDAIIRAIRAKYRGMNEATMQTIGGMLGNVDDAMVRSMAKMGQAVEGTVIGWLKTIMGVFEKIEAFADTGLGKAVANTLLWGTAIMGAVTALALLGAGMITILGLFAAYRVFMQARSGTMSQIIAAELELSKITKELAAIEAQRGLADIETMRARLALLQAIRVEEEARAKVILMENAGVTGPQLSKARAGVAAAGAARGVAQLAYDKQMLPQEIMRIEDEILVAKSAQNAIQKDLIAGEQGLKAVNIEQLMAARAHTAELERQNALLHERLAAARLGVGDAGIVAKTDTFRSAMIGNINAQSGLAGARRTVDTLRAEADAAAIAVNEARVKMQETANAANLAFMSLQSDRFNASGNPNWSFFDAQQDADAKALAASQARAEYEAAVTASRATNASLATAEAAAEQAQTVASAAQATYEAELSAALAARPALAAKYGAVQAQINRMKAMEAKTQAEILDLGNLAGAAEQRQLAIIRERIAAREAELAVMRNQLATETSTTAVGMGGAARFSRGMMAGAGAVFGPILGLVEGIANIVAGPFIALGQAIGAANLGFVGIAGVVTGFAAALASLIGVAYLVSSTLKYDAQSLRSFRDGLDEATDKLSDWADLLAGTNPGMQWNAERAKNIREIEGKVGGPSSWGGFSWKELGKDFLRFILSPGRLVGDTFRSGLAPGMEDRFDFGKLLLKKTDNIDDARMYLQDAVAAAQKSGNVPKAFEGLTPEMVRGMDAEAIRKITLTAQERAVLSADIDTYLRSQNRELEKQGFALDRQAIQWMKRRIASGELTEEEKERYKTMMASATPAKDLNKHLKDSFKNAEQMIPDLRDIEEVISEGMAAGKPDADIQGEIKKDRDAAAQKLEEMEASLQAQRDIGFQISTEDERRVKQLHEQVDLVNRQVNLYGTIKQLQADQNAQGTVSASGMGNTGAIFGDDIAAGEWAKAQAEKDPKKRQTAIENAFKAARASHENKAKQALDLYAPGPTASPAEKAKYERYKGTVEKWRMDRVEADYRKAISAGNLTPEQRARAERQIAAERRASANTVAGFEKSARDIEMEDAAKQMEARRRGAAVAGASPQQLAQLDMNILRIRMQQAKVNNDITEQMNLQVQAAEIMRGLQDAALGTEEAKLSYMQTQADQGLISQDAVDAEKRQLAAMYQNRARQAAAGSQEYYENMNKALSLLGDDTEEKWSGIIGKILGAPQSLIDSVVSSGWITQGFGGMENQFGMGRGMQAEIASQSRREMVIRVSWDLGSVDRRLEAALPQAMNSFGRDLIRGMDAA